MSNFVQLVYTGLNLEMVIIFFLISLRIGSYASLCGYGKILPNCMFSVLHWNAQLLARSFNGIAQSGEMKTQANNICLFAA